ncbi:hypothetical protein H5410_062933 [Solanum commersonii]|uniref:Thaumatin-like protein n=1 Tax=Solanum commersonii TaxID=4109 RepID=A0A9J5WCX1_SOLCO|nr:hypothetical protein H5410_062933 [Solanum commersonii]
MYFLNHAATFDITNRCTYPVWATASPGEADDSTRAKLGRTNCNFDGNGRGKYESEIGDCNGLLECQGYGSPPNTLAEFALNQPNNLDFVDISLVDGFNIPIEFSPINGGGRNLLCNTPIND